MVRQVSNKQTLKGGWYIKDIIGKYIVNESSRCCSHPGWAGYDREKAIACDTIKELSSRIMFFTIE